MSTGLRITDVLALKSDDVRRASRITLRELKTGKKRQITLGGELRDKLLAVAGKIYVFENRLDHRKHRTRQAVFKDLKRVARAFRVKPNIAPHTARKVWAVEQYRKDGDLKRVQRLLNHSSEAVTVIYAMADQVIARGKRGRPKKSGTSGQQV